MSYVYGIFLLCCMSTLFSADISDDSKRLIRLQWGDEYLDVSASQLNKYSYFKPLLDLKKDSASIAMKVGSSSEMKFIFDDTGQDYSNKTTKQVVAIIDLIDFLGGPEDMVDDAINVLHKRFESQSSGISEVFTSSGVWGNRLKLRYAAQLAFLHPLNNRHNFRRSGVFDLEQGFRLKGVSCLGTYALLSKKENAVSRSMKIINTSSAKEVYSSRYKGADDCFFSDFHDAFFLIRNGTSQMKIIDVTFVADEDEVQMPARMKIKTFALTPDGKKVVAGGIEKIICIDRNTKETTAFNIPGRKTCVLKCSHDGKFFMTIEKQLQADTKRLVLRDSNTLGSIWDKNAAGIMDFAFSPDGLTATSIGKQGRSRSKLVDLKTSNYIGGITFGPGCSVKRVCYCKDRPIAVLKYSVFSKHRAELKYLIYPATFFGQSNMVLPGSAWFSQNGKLFYEDSFDNPRRIEAYDIDVALQPETLTMLPVSLFYVLNTSNQLPAIIDAHAHALIEIRNKVPDADRKIIDGLLECFNRTTTGCSVS